MDKNVELAKELFAAEIKWKHLMDLRFSKIFKWLLWQQQKPYNSVFLQQKTFKLCKQ